MPGWYPDPSGAPGQRYFDGVNWGPVAPPPITPPYPSGPGQPGGTASGSERRFTIHYGFALLAIFSLLGTIIPSIFWFVSAANVDNDGTKSDIEAANAATGIMGFFGIGWLLWGGMWTIVWTAFAIQHTLKSRRA